MGCPCWSADEAGGLIASVDSLVSREVSTEQLSEASSRGRHRDSLFMMDWCRFAS